MVVIYVLESEKDGRWYTGMAIHATSRLHEHNSGKNRFTKSHLPWKIIYLENCADWKAVRIREKYLKSAAGKRWLVKMLNSNENTGSLPD